MVDYEKLSELREKVQLLTKAENDLQFISADVYNCGMEDEGLKLDDVQIAIRAQLKKLENELNIMEDEFEKTYEGALAWS
jgi:hypothetical protein